MFNKVILVGNLTRDLELRYLQSGTAVGNTGLAVNRRFKSANGEQKDETLFIDLTFFGRSAEIANQYLHKGSKILVEGRLKLDSWKDQNGHNRNKYTVVVENMQMLDNKNNSTTSMSPTSNQGYNQPATQPNGYSNPPEIDISEDDLPF